MHELPDPKHARARALLVRSFTVVGRGALNVLGVTTILMATPFVATFLGMYVITVFEFLTDEYERDLWYRWLKRRIGK